MLGIFSLALHGICRVTRFMISILVSVSKPNSFFRITICISGGCINKFNIFLRLVQTDVKKNSVNSEHRSV